MIWLDALEAKICQISARGFTWQDSPYCFGALIWALREPVVWSAGAYQWPRVRSL